MLMPKRVKRRKQFRGTMKGKALRGNKISYGEYGIVAMEPCWIRSNQIEAAQQLERHFDLQCINYLANAKSFLAQT